MEVQYAVELAMFCKTLKQLPKAGGILDQDSYHMHLIKIALEAIAEREQKEHDEAMSKSKGRAGRKVR